MRLKVGCECMYKECNRVSKMKFATFSKRV